MSALRPVCSLGTAQEEVPELWMERKEKEGIVSALPADVPLCGGGKARVNSNIKR